MLACHMDAQILKTRLETQALSEGFAAIGICAPDATPESAPRLRAFLAAGYHGQMHWLAEREDWRGSAAALWPQARSVIMLAEAYTPETNPLAILDHRDKAAISVYAQGRDYHDIVKKRLKRLGRRRKWRLCPCGQGWRGGWFRACRPQPA